MTTLTPLGLCPQCHRQTIIADRVRCADRLWCDGEHCTFYMVQADPGFERAYAKAFPAPSGYNDVMLTGALPLAVGGERPK